MKRLMDKGSHALLGFSPVRNFFYKGRHELAHQGP
jgi:hypothetical protein